MPIDLTTVDGEGGVDRHKRRRRKHRDKQTSHLLTALLAGVGLLALLAGVLVIVQWDRLKPRRADSGLAENPHIPKWNKPGETADEGKNGTETESVDAINSGELPRDQAQARIHSLRRVVNPAKGDSLRLEYEFLKPLDPPHKFVIIVRTPNGVGKVNFRIDAARTDVVEISSALSKLGSRGPIEVWIESLFPPDVRVSNVMTLP